MDGGFGRTAPNHRTLCGHELRTPDRLWQGHQAQHGLGRQCAWPPGDDCLSERSIWPGRERTRLGSRGDMYQTPSGSSTGAGASLAGYAWLDHSVGTHSMYSCTLSWLLYRNSQSIWKHSPPRGFQRSHCSQDHLRYRLDARHRTKLQVRIPILCPDLTRV